MLNTVNTTVILDGETLKNCVKAVLTFSAEDIIICADLHTSIWNEDHYKVRRGVVVKSIKSSPDSNHIEIECSSLANHIIYYVKKEEIE